ncbi:MAG: type II secretion system F family protein [Planctomycetes bacterium]|nr:type II secretion system F family protein [Planctomycetota bacterium]
MPTFNYTALKPGSPGEIKGRVDADTDRDARNKIRARGEVPVKVTVLRVSKGFGVGFSLRRSHQKEVLLFTTQLSTLIRSGITLTDAIKVLGEQTGSRHFSDILSIVYQSVVEKGYSFADALKEFNNCFSPMYVAMVRAGESTGNLPEVLVRLTHYAKKRSEIEGKITSAMVYPVIMLVMGLLVVVFLLSYLVPQIVPILLERGKGLPLPTIILVGISDALKNYWWLGIAAVALAVAAYRFTVPRTAGRLFVDTAIISTPIFGDIIKKGAVSRFCLTLSGLLHSGVRIEEALQIVEHVVSNAAVSKTVREIGERIREGSSISGPLAKSKTFPRVVTYMISVGEKAGSEELQEMLDNIAESYDLEIEQSASRLTALLNPLLLLFLAGVVFFILLAILLPIMSLSSGI